jgi:hypothetical protein
VENFNLYPDVRSTDESHEMRRSRTQAMEFATITELTPESRWNSFRSPESRRASWGGSRSAVAFAVNVSAASRAVHVSSSGHPCASVAVEDEDEGGHGQDLEANVSGQHLSDADLNRGASVAVELASLNTRPEMSTSMPREADVGLEEGTSSGRRRFSDC